MGLFVVGTVAGDETVAVTVEDGLMVAVGEVACEGVTVCFEQPADIRTASINTTDTTNLNLCIIIDTL